MQDTPPAELLPHSAPEPDNGRLSRLIVAFGKPFSIVFIVIALMLIYEVVLRYVFAWPTIWVHETSTFLCAVSFLVGGLYSVATNKHIRIVLVYDAVSARVRRWLDVFIYAICAASTLFFSYGAWLSAKRAIFSPSGALRLETSGTAWNPPYPSILKLLLVLTLLVMSVQFPLLMLRALRGKGQDNV